MSPEHDHVAQGRRRGSAPATRSIRGIAIAVALAAGGCGGGGGGGGGGPARPVGPVLAVTGVTLRGTIASDPAMSQLRVDGTPVPLSGRTWSHRVALPPGAADHEVLVELRVDGVVAAERRVRVGPRP